MFENCISNNVFPERSSGKMDDSNQKMDIKLSTLVGAQIKVFVSRKMAQHPSKTAEFYAINN